MGIALNYTEKDEYNWIDIVAKDAIPSELKTLTLPPVNPNKGLVLNGRASNWIYSNLVQKYADKCRWVANLYPNIKGAVVVYTNSPDYEDGDVIATYFGVPSAGQ